jgi:hypothetical protein
MRKIYSIVIPPDLWYDGAEIWGDSMSSEEYMRQALALARQAADEGEVPVGFCVWTGKAG